MKKYIYKDFKIIKLNDILKEQYKSKYIITINRDIFAFGDTLKECYKKIKKGGF